MKRAIRVKLQPSKEQERVLFELAQAIAVVWNKINYQRLKQFKTFGKIDFAGTEKEAYHNFKDWIGGSTVQQLARKNAESWRSFFALSRKKKAGKLPEWFKPRPPAFIRERNDKKLFVIPLRNDQYKIENNILELRRLGKFGKLRIQFKGGRIYLKGKQGRLEITYDPVRRKWYAHISYTVEERLYREGWVEVPRQPIGNLSAGIDLGINNLIAVYVENGESFLVNGRPLKSIAFYFRRGIAKVQSKINKSGTKKSRKLRKMHLNAKLQMKHYIDTMVRRTIERLYRLGVSKIYVGYPKGISRNSNKNKKLNYLLSTVWHFSYVIKRLKEVSEEYGIKVKLVDEAFTSQVCPLCGQRHENARLVRGLFKCHREGVVMNSDLVGAFNILKKAARTITPPSLPALAGGRGGNWGVATPRGGVRRTQFELGSDEDPPQTSPPLG
ncbi:RNA-guided endonuclease TnpB family protein [Thermococcus sp. JCM 11816]|uniref:RNA-guided endonuclease InsQ/TnpB family protein n=1 Tax=Thermococcus sp. (strain JCM 11816 / KS-1) TaxID=1295125 RepID=UPI0006D23F6E